MKIPTPKKKPSGKWYIQMRLAGESVYLTGWDKAALVKEAQLVKAEYLAGKRAAEAAAESEERPSAPTLREAFDAYLKDASNTLSPSTIRFYRIVQKNRFQAVMDRCVDAIADKEWQGIINTEAAKYAPKTLRNGYGAVKSVIHAATGHTLPDVTFPGVVPPPRNFLLPDEIPKFVEAVKGTKYAVPLLLALSSMRISEIHALDWANIPEDPDFIRVSGAVVLDETNKYKKKKQNKNATSARNVPILIPALQEAIRRDRKPSGPVMPCSQNNLRLACHRICQEAGLTDVGVHGLRHSFASLAYHLRIPEEIAMEIGGWADATTMHKVYLHIAQSDITRYRTALADFYAGRDPTKEKAETAHAVPAEGSPAAAAEQ